MFKGAIKIGDHVKWNYYHGIHHGSGVVLRIVNRSCHYAIVDTGKIDGILHVPYSVLELYN